MAKAKEKEEQSSTPLPEFKETTVTEGEIRFTSRDPETGELVIGFVKENTK